ncbi:MAG: hypothetical protein ON057_001782 [Glomeribacter sp. 1016415]|nr:hypothetical protein [Glomeribacter sp. 1016415]
MTQAPIVSLEIRRDAHTTTPTSVFKHELGILCSLYGKENVSVGDIFCKREIEIDNEYLRLVGKYGEKVVTDIFGVSESPALANAIQSIAQQKPVAKTGASIKG